MNTTTMNKLELIKFLTTSAGKLSLFENEENNYKLVLSDGCLSRKINVCFNESTFNFYLAFSKKMSNESIVFFNNVFDNSVKNIDIELLNYIKEKNKEYDIRFKFTKKISSEYYSTVGLADGSIHNNNYVTLVHNLRDYFVFQTELFSVDERNLLTNTPDLFQFLLRNMNDYFIFGSKNYQEIHDKIMECIS